MKIGLLRALVFDKPLTGTVEEIAAAMRGYAELGVRHIMVQCVPFSQQSLQRLTEALQLYRGSAAQRAERSSSP